jgi:hypothetical protein
VAEKQHRARLAVAQRAEERPLDRHDDRLGHGAAGLEADGGRRGGSVPASSTVTFACWTLDAGCAICSVAVGREAGGCVLEQAPSRRSPSEITL